MKARNLLAGTLALALVPASVTLAAGGNVSAVRDPTTGVLRITGDADANDFEVTAADPLSSTYTVTGRNGTTVNLGAAETFENVRGLTILAGAGDDVVDVTSLRVATNLNIQAGDGADTIRVNGVRVLGRLVVAGGVGSDSILVNGFFKRPSAIRGGEGNDAITLSHATFTYGSALLLNSGMGNDTVFLDTCEFKEGSDAHIICRGGDDELRTDESEFDDDLEVRMGGGDDHVLFDDSEFDEKVDLDGGPGHDDLSIRSGNQFRHVPSIHDFEE
jgi:hypothetical protein